MSDRERWEKDTYGHFVKKAPERSVRFETLSGIPIKPLYTPEDVTGSYAEKIGYPGEYPYTRGVYPTMYRGRLWTMRMFAGFGRPEDTNARFKYLLKEGQTGLSTAFDMPALMGYDADHPRARGEVGKEGVSISTLDDFERLFADIPLADVTTSMTINCTASVALAMYLAVAEKQGVSWDRIGGTIQNDMLKEFIAQKEWICPPEPAVRIVTDMVEFTATHVPRWNPISISGYHIREAGSTAVQELAFTLADGLAYVEAALARGLDVDSFAPRLRFFFDVHNDFFEEIAKLRAARRLWARYMKERYGATKAASMLLRTHTQTAGVSATAQQPLNNIARVTVQAMAGILGGLQSMHTDAYDEALSCPSEYGARIAIATQNILREEAQLTDVIDPLGGSFYVETLTDQMEAEIERGMAIVEGAGGMYQAVESGLVQRMIGESAARFQHQVDCGERTIVGVNAYQVEEDSTARPINTRPDRAAMQAHVDAFKAFKAQRPQAAVQGALDALARSAGDRHDNVFARVVEAAEAGCTHGEICRTLRREMGFGNVQAMV